MTALLAYIYRCVSPPGPLLNAINLLVHTPVVAPIVQAVWWAVLCAVTVCLAPLVVLDGVLKAWADASATEVSPSERAKLGIVVTGCDSGFGRTLAVHLARSGYTVFAGCLAATADNGLSSEAPDGQLRVCSMDVTSQTAVDGAAENIRAWVDAAPGRRLLAVTNNAGVGTGGFFDWLKLDDYERDLAVNYLGVVRVCKAFLPLLKRSAAAAGRGEGAPRILIVSSMSGKLPVPLLSSYSASKHAAASFAACLRMELEHLWGIHVSTALPSFHRTPLTEGGLGTITRKWQALPAETKAVYGEGCKASSFEIAHQMMTDWAWEPARVTEELARAITQTRAPPIELTIGGDARFGLNVVRHLPPAVYEAFIWYWYAWNLVPPAQRAQA